jgi:hypothetical protein
VWIFVVHLRLLYFFTERRQDLSKQPQKKQGQYFAGRPKKIN